MTGPFGAGRDYTTYLIIVKEILLNKLNLRNRFETKASTKTAKAIGKNDRCYRLLDIPRKIKKNGSV